MATTDSAAAMPTTSVAELKAKVAATKEPSPKEASSSDAEMSVDSSLCSEVSVAPKLPAEQYYLWGCELTKDKPELKLDLSGVDEDVERHHLQMRHVVLGEGAVNGERNIVEVVANDQSGEEKRLQVASLTMGRSEFQRIDLTLTWSSTRPILVRLVKGSGPVTLTGNHFVEFLDEDSEDADYEPVESADESCMEDLEKVDEDELQDLAKDAKENGIDVKAEEKRKTPSGSSK